VVIVSIVNRPSTSKFRSVRNLRAIAAVVVSGLVAVGGLQHFSPVKAASFTSYSQQALAFFGKGSPGNAVYGANEVVEVITGNPFLPEPFCPSGVPDPKSLVIITVTDVYVVPDGDPSLTSGGQIGGIKHVLGPALGGLNLTTQIGTTGPTGSLGTGSYTVVFDECQDGTINVHDAVFESAFKVVVPLDAPTDPGLLALKADARANFVAAAKTEAAVCLVLDVVDIVTDPKAAAKELIKEQITDRLPAQLAAFQASTEAPPSRPSCANFTDTTNMWEGIANDPPDPDFQRGTTFASTWQSAIEGPVGDAGRSSEPITRVGTAMRMAVERYQGAVAAGDAAWASAHAKQANNLAKIFETLLAEESAAVTAARAQANAAPGLDATLVRAAALKQRIISSTLTARDTGALLSGGLTPGEITLLPAKLAKNPLYFDSFAGLDAALDASIGRLAQFRQDLVALRGSLDVIAPKLDGQAFVPQIAPSAGSALYARGAVALNGSAMIPTGRLVKLADWDINGDGTFGDATGLTPTVDLTNAGRVISLRVIDDAGNVTISSALVSGYPQLLTASTPLRQLTVLNVGEAATFAVTPQAGVAVEWTSDGQPVGTTSSYSFTPALAQTGTIRVVAKLTRGPFVTYRKWNVEVIAPDLDLDGYAANIDCNDNDANVTDCAKRIEWKRIVTGTPNVTTGIAFTPDGYLYATTNNGGGLWRFPRTGGTASDPGVYLGNSMGPVIGLATAPSGKLYGAPYNGTLSEINPTTGAVVRSVRTGVPNTQTGLAFDPVSGDAYIGSAGGLFRVSNIESANPTLTTVASGFGADGVTVAPDRTIWVAHYQVGLRHYAPSGELLGTVSVPNIDGTGIEPGSNGTTAAVWGNNTDGTLSRIDLTVTPPKAAIVGNHGAYGDMAVVGPDGCFYASSGGSVVKVTNSDGTCGLVSSAPTLTLSSPGEVQSPTRVSVSARITNVSLFAGSTVTFTIGGAGSATGTATVDATGTATFTFDAPTPGVYTVNATSSANGIKLVAIPTSLKAVAAPNSAPETTSGSAIVAQGASGTVSLQGTDVNRDALTYRVLVPPAHGTLTNVQGGAPIYTPDPAFSGIDRFVYEAFDGQLASRAATVTINVTPTVTNKPPVIADAQATTAGVPVTITPTVSDPEGQAVTIGNAGYEGIAQNGTVQLVNGTFVYTPKPNFVGRDLFVITATDASGAVGSGFAYVTVTPAPTTTTTTTTTTSTTSTTTSTTKPPTTTTTAPCRHDDDDEDDEDDKDDKDDKDDDDQGDDKGDKYKKRSGSGRGDHDDECDDDSEHDPKPTSTTKKPRTTTTTTKKPRPTTTTTTTKKPRWTGTTTSIKKRHR
jgi:Bacterial Ig domain